jgi:hypothetical protein
MAIQDISSIKSKPATTSAPTDANYSRPLAIVFHVGLSDVLE